VAVITLIVGSVGLFVAGFVAWYTLWRLRLASRLERVPVKSGRPLYVLHEGVEFPRDRE
jgi:hypothetical protein